MTRKEIRIDPIIPLAAQSRNASEINPAIVGSCGAATITTCNTVANQNSRRLFTRLGLPGNAYYADVDQMDTGGTSSYNGMILSAQFVGPVA